MDRAGVSALGVFAAVTALGAPLAARAAASPTLVATPGLVDISERDDLELRADGVREGARLVVEVGRVEPLPAPGGSVRGRWVLPRDLTPRRVAAAVVDGGGASFVVVPVWRRARLHVTASPGARIRLRLRRELAAEGVADAFGRLDLAVRIPPAVDLADVEQELSGKSDAASKLRELDVRNELHVLAVVLGEAVPADGKAAVPVLALAYRDDGRPGVEVRRVGTEDGRTLPLERPGPGLARVSVTAGPWLERAPPPALALTVEAHDDAGAGKATVSVAIAKLPPREIRFVAPPQPWEAGEVVEVAASAVDAVGRIMDEVPLTASVTKSPDAPPIVLVGAALAPGHGQRFLLRAPQRLPAGAHAYALEVRAGDGLRAELPIRLAAGAPASLRLAPGGQAKGGRELTVEAVDRFGNGVTSAAPTLAATVGSVTSEPGEHAGLHSAVWLAPDPRRSSEAVVEASFPGTSVRAAANVRYVAPRPQVGLGLYAGVTADGGALTAPSVTVVASYAPLALPDDLALVLSASAARATRDQRGEDGGAEVDLQRTALLAPITVGAEWRFALARRLTLRVGAGTGALVASTSTTVREGSGRLQPASGAAGVSWMWRGSVRVGWSLGPGEVTLLTEMWDALTRATAFAGRPRAGTAALGYSVDLSP